MLQFGCGANRAGLPSISFSKPHIAVQKQTGLEDFDDAADASSEPGCFAARDFPRLMFQVNRAGIAEGSTS
jgi:hypothetical protein